MALNNGTLEGVYFLHDGARAHTALATKTYLDLNFPQRWIGNNGYYKWPARSPDLTVINDSCRENCLMICPFSAT